VWEDGGREAPSYPIPDAHFEKRSGARGSPRFPADRVLGVYPFPVLLRYGPATVS